MRIRRRGFTLVEALVSLCCVGVLVLGVAEGLPNSADLANQTECESRMRQIGQMYGQYMNDYAGYFPLNGDYQNYPEYQPRVGGGGQPPYMTRHPDSILAGPHNGPWFFAEKLARYNPDTQLWLSPQRQATGRSLSAPQMFQNEPYHPLVECHFVQTNHVGDGTSSKRLRDLGGRPSDVFVMSNGSGAMLGGSGLFDNASCLRPSAARIAFNYGRSYTDDCAVEGSGKQVTGIGLNPYLFADMHVEFLRFWEVFDNTRGPSTPGSQDGRYYVARPGGLADVKRCGQ